MAKCLYEYVKGIPVYAGAIMSNHGQTIEKERGKTKMKKKE